MWETDLFVRVSASDHVTHTDRYVQRRDPDRAVKPPPLELPHCQEGDHMRRLAVLTANSQSLLCLAAAAKKAVLPRFTFAAFDWVTGSLEARPVPGRLFETSRQLEQDRKWSASGLYVIGKLNQPERSGWVGLRPGVIGCLQLKLEKQEKQAKQPVSLQDHPP